MGIPMPIPKADIIALWISDEGLNTDFKNIRVVSFDVLSSHLTENSKEEISEIVEGAEAQIVQELFKLNDQNISDGVIPRFELFSESDTNYIKFIDRPEVTFLEELRQESPQQFELFCKRVLEKLGATAFVEGGPGDGGIDFIGFELPVGFYRGPTSSGGKVVVIGQAKRYKAGNNISETDLRSFIGAAVRRAYELKRKSSEKVGSLQPIVYAFWTTSDFHQNAKTYAREMGIWYLSGLALAQLATRVGLNSL